MEEGHGTTWIRLASALAVDRPGGDTLEGRELGSRKARTLLALLAAERGALVPLDRIVEALWPEAYRPPTRPPTWPPSSAGPGGCSAPTC